MLSAHAHIAAMHWTLICIKILIFLQVGDRAVGLYKNGMHRPLTAAAEDCTSPYEYYMQALPWPPLLGFPENKDTMLWDSMRLSVNRTGYVMPRTT